MKKLLICAIFLSVVIFASAGYAHPPSDIDITFDRGTKMLTAVITHGTGKPAKHYVKRVDVDLNGKEIIRQKISKAENGKRQMVSYLIPDAKPGNEITVEGFCNRRGKLKRKIKI